jgi:hypothetical protein
VFRDDRSLAASNEFAVTAVLREVKGGRAKFGQFYFAWVVFEFFIVVLDLFCLHAILAS